MRELFLADKTKLGFFSLGHDSGKTFYFNPSWDIVMDVQL
jgi:hypothetical protein